ncbi:MAG: DUF1491 family protein [Pseudomonadota bacterium]
MRLTTELWVSALLRRAQSDGSYATVLKKGAAEAGAVFIVIMKDRSTFDLLSPAPQTVYGADTEGSGLERDSRQFQVILENEPLSDIDRALEKQRSFDPDLWVIEIEDREGRSFVQLAAE